MSPAARAAFQESPALDEAALDRIAGRLIAQAEPARNGVPLGLPAVALAFVFGAGLVVTSGYRRGAPAEG